MIHRTIMSVVVLCHLLGTADAAADEPADRRGLEAGPAAEFLWGPFSTLVGPWFAAGAAVDARWASPFHLRGKLLLAVGRTSLASGPGSFADGKIDSSSMMVGGALLRILPSVDLGRFFVVRVGPAAAALVGEYSSSLCGSESYNDIALGASGELGLRFGQDSAFELGGQVDAILVTPPRCQEGPGSDPFTVGPPRNKAEDNVGLFVGAAFTFVLTH